MVCVFFHCLWLLKLLLLLLLLSKSLQLCCNLAEPSSIRCHTTVTVINTAGGISKTDIRRFLYWAADNLGYSELRGVVAAPPSAELEPIREGEAAQTDEQDMGMTYDVSR